MADVPSKRPIITVIKFAIGDEDTISVANDKSVDDVGIVPNIKITSLS